MIPIFRTAYHEPNDAVGYAKFYSRSHAVVIRVFDESGLMVETHESVGAFREP